MSIRLRARGVRRATGPWPPGNQSRGQATVEFALLLPVVVVLLMTVIQVGVLVRARIMVTHAARESARVAAVGSPNAEITRAAVVSGGLAPNRVSVEVRPNGEVVTVVVHYRAPTNLPFVGALIDDVDLSATATMRREDQG